MRLKDVIELIRVDMPDYTEGAFDIKVELDDGGSHITIYMEDHTNYQQVLSDFYVRFREQRIIVKLLPENFLHRDIRQQLSFKTIFCTK